MNPDCEDRISYGFVHMLSPLTPAKMKPNVWGTDDVFGST